MNILITGTSGFLGNRVAELLATQTTHNLFGIDRNPPINGHILKGHIRGDLANPTTLAGLSEPIDIVIHTAADVDRCLDEKCVVDNLYALHVLGVWARERHVQRIIYPSTTGIYAADGAIPVTEAQCAQPRSLYGVTKYLAEQYLLTCGVETIIVRFSYLCGAGDTKGTLADIIRGVLDNTQVSVRDEARDYLDVGDAANAIILAIDYRGTRRHFNCGTGNLTPMTRLVELVGLITNLSPRQPAIRGSRNNAAVDSTLARTELRWTVQEQLVDSIREEVEFLRRHR